MNNTDDGGYTENQLVTIGGYCFVCRVTAIWKDGKYIARKDFTEDMEKALRKHHCDTLKERISNVGG